MPILKNFRFSAKNLQDYLDCPRRFELRYLLKQEWPSEVTQPVQEVEKRIWLGNQFHSLVNRFLNGVPEDKIQDYIFDSELKVWFSVFLEFYRQSLNQRFLSEVSLFLPYKGFFMAAVVDYLSLRENGELLIYDWKTSSFPPKENYFADSVQTILYPFIVYECRKTLFPNHDLNTEDLSMNYWFPAFPEKSFRFPYSNQIHQQNQERLSNFISEIVETCPGEFQKTDQVKRCKYCEYRSLCERGVSAGNIYDEKEALDVESLIQNITFESTEEISY